jgi:hypothetical protein
MEAFHGGTRECRETDVCRRVWDMENGVGRWMRGVGSGSAVELRVGCGIESGFGGGW